MPNPNAIVSGGIRFDPPLDRSPREILRAERGLVVVLDGDRRARLDASDRRSPGFVDVLAGLGRERLPVYSEVDPSSGAVTRLLIPYVVRVANVTSLGDEIAIELDTSHARHILQRSSPDAVTLEKELWDALRTRRVVIVTDDDAHNILDVRAFTPSPDGPSPPLPPFPALPKPRPWPWPLDQIVRWWEWLRRILCWPWCR